MKHYLPLTRTLGVCISVPICVCAAAAVTCQQRGDRWECVYLYLCKCTNGVCVCLCLKQYSEVLGDLSGGVEVASL